MMYTNLIWMWGHPEVYILILPAFGVFSEIVSTFSGKPIASYKSNILGMIGVSTLALSVWLHHFFTMGANADVNSFFGIMTVAIAIPTSVLIYTWIATMHKGRIRLKTPMLWFLGFVGIFAVGGITGVMLAIPPVDFQLHNSLFLVAHFHSTVIGGVLFGIFAGLSYWFPKIAGFRLNERIGRYAVWSWIVGFFLAFTPLYILGLMGASRRLDHYDSATGWRPFFIVSLIGSLVISLGVAFQIIQIIASFIEKKKLIDNTGDPWDGRNLEWSVPSPAPAYNFAVLPEVSSREAFLQMKSVGIKTPRYEDINIPKNTASGIYISGFAFLVGFGFVWHINWLAVVSIIAIIICFIKKAFDEDSEYTLKAQDVEKMARTHEAKMQAAHKSGQMRHTDDDDMGLIEFVRIVLTWAYKLLRRKT